MRTRKRFPFRQSPRSWSIRAKIVSLVLIPLVTLVGMWALATYVTVIPGLQLFQGKSALDNIGRPGGALLAEIQAERKVSIAYLAGGRRNAAALTAQRATTDTAITSFEQVAGSPDTLGGSNALTVSKLTTLLSTLDNIGRIRGTVDRGDVDRAGAFQQYSDITDLIDQVFAALPSIADENLAREANNLLVLGRAREILSREDAVLAGAIAAGSFTGAELNQTVLLIGAQRYLYADALPGLYPAMRDDYNRLAATEPFLQLKVLEDRLLSDARAGARVPIDAGSWTAAYDKVAQELRDFEFRASADLIDRSNPAALRIIARIAVAGVLGLIAVLITMIASIRIGRSLIKRLAGLRQAAAELAVDRLPRVMARLRNGEELDVETEAPPLPYGDDEIGQVGHAFNELQRAAVNSAVDEANVRRGLNEVFLNIARRSQTLLHRQLSILDRMERRTEDPAELEDLFRVDHLATRMRRHAEDLVILAGASPGRGWRNPVPIVDVLRGAVSEVEDYARVSIRPMPEVALTGRAVGDVIHLLAELIENATSFSPPHTRVNVGGERVSHGFAIEIEDRGLGMPAEALDECNRRLANPPNFDPANSAQLGLFVVARLAERNGVKVGLRSSPYGGVTAVVLLPGELVVEGREAVPALLGRYGPNGNGRAERLREITTGPLPAIGAAPVPPARQVAVDAHIVDTPPAMERPNPRHARQEVIEAPVSDGLPRRVRQTNIAPQLRDEPPTPGVDTAWGAGPDGRTSGAMAASSRSPEELRAMMTSFQAGTTRGRREADDDGEPGAASRGQREAQ
jgi:signal transduction histidine kinase